jgi:hypothetical protein
MWSEVRKKERTRCGEQTRTVKFAVPVNGANLDVSGLESSMCRNADEFGIESRQLFAGKQAYSRL